MKKLNAFNIASLFILISNLELLANHSTLLIDKMLQSTTPD